MQARYPYSNGATGTIGAARVARADADGLTLLGTSIGPQAIAPHVMGKLAYDPVADFAPVIMIGTIPHLLVVGKAQPFKTVAELVAAAKKAPESLAYASGGTGTILHMQGELLQQKTGARFLHVPYKGDTPALQDTLVGQVQFAFIPAAAALPHVQTGALRALATTSAQRLSTLPDVPTMAQAGLTSSFFYSEQETLMANQDIIKGFPRVGADIVRRAAELQPAILADVAGRRGALNGRIRPLHPGMKVAGTALTVEVRPGDNLMIHAAISLARPGDVLVIDGKGDLSSALMGTIMMTACRKLGIAGVVMDGAARDTVEIIEMDYPVFAAGTNPNGPTKNVPGRIGHPVSVGGVTVHPGDFVIGDADGVVVVEREKIEGLLPAAEKKVRDEAARIAAIQAGDTEAKWLDAALRAAGVLKEGESL